MKKMILVFNESDGSLHMAASNLVPFYNDNDDFVIVRDVEFDPEYNWSLIDGEAVKGDLITFTDEEIATYEADAISTAHHTPRMLSYPSIEEQLDKLYSDIKNDTLDRTGEFFTAIKAVKDANPKSE